MLLGVLAVDLRLEGCHCRKVRMQVIKTEGRPWRHIVPAIVTVVFFSGALAVSAVEKQAHDAAQPLKTITQIGASPNATTLQPGQIGHVSSTTPTGVHIVLSLPNCPWIDEVRSGPWKRRCIVTDSQHDRQLAVFTPLAIQSLGVFDQQDRQALAAGHVVAFDPQWSSQRAKTRKITMNAVRSTTRNSDNWPTGQEEISASPVLVRTLSRNQDQETELVGSGLGRRAGYRFAIAQSALPSAVTVSPTHDLTGSDKSHWGDQSAYGWFQAVVASGVIGIAGGVLSWVFLGASIANTSRFRNVVVRGKDTNIGV